MDKEEFNEIQSEALDNEVVLKTLSEELLNDVDELLRHFSLSEDYTLAVLATASARYILQKGLSTNRTKGVETMRKIFLFGLNYKLDEFKQAEACETVNLHH
jgi:hypothetical protein